MNTYPRYFISTISGEWTPDTIYLVIYNATDYGTYFMEDSRWVIEGGASWTFNLQACEKRLKDGTFREIPAAEAVLML